MRPDRPSFHNQQGFGLMTAIFVIVILALFGLLVARYTQISALSSSEDYLWAEAIYAADTTAQRTILFHDKGGGGGAYPGNPTVAGFTTNRTIVGGTLGGNGVPTTIRVNATRPVSPTENIRREIEVKYIL